MALWQLQQWWAPGQKPRGRRQEPELLVAESGIGLLGQRQRLAAGRDGSAVGCIGRLRLIRGLAVSLAHGGRARVKDTRAGPLLSHAASRLRAERLHLVGTDTAGCRSCNCERSAVSGG